MLAPFLRGDLLPYDSEFVRIRAIFSSFFSSSWSFSQSICRPRLVFIFFFFVIEVSCKSLVDSGGFPFPYVDKTAP